MGDPLKPAALRVRNGDTAAYREIVDATSARLVRFAARMLGSVADAEDVVQEAYVKAHRAIADGDFDARSSVSTWLHRIVANATIDAIRARKRRPTPTDTLPEGASDGLATAEAWVALAELTDLLDVLPAEQRAAMVLRAVEGRTTAEAAEILEISEGAVEQRLVRARATLRERSNRSD